MWRCHTWIGLALALPGCPTFGPLDGGVDASVDATRPEASVDAARIDGAGDDANTDADRGVDVRGARVDGSMQADIGDTGPDACLQAEICDLRDNTCNGVCDEGTGCRRPIYRSVRTGRLGRQWLFSTSQGEGPSQGYTPVDIVFWVYRTPAAGLIPLFRCMRPTPDGPRYHLANESTCTDGTGDGLLGFVARSQSVCNAATIFAFRCNTYEWNATLDPNEYESAVQMGCIRDPSVGSAWPDEP